MKKIIIYHGSEKIIKKPLLSLGKINNDYGQGFYCTEDIELAKEWACKHFNDGFANKYELDVSNLNILNLNDIDNNVMTWIAILIKNRKFDKSPQQKTMSELIIKYFDIDLSKYDIVIGYRADDSYFSYAQKFLENSLSSENLERSLKFGMLGSQIVLISEKAFENLKYIGNEVALEEEYSQKFIVRDVNARHEFANLLQKLEINGTYAIDIIRKEGKKK